MSVKIMGYVFDSGLPTTSKIVMLALADFANEEGESIYPSLETLSKRTGMSTRSVMRILSSLRTKGYIESVGSRPSGVKVYRMNVNKLTHDSVSPPPDTESPPPLTQSHPPPDTESPDPLVDPPIDPPKREGAPAPAPKTRERDPLFDAIANVCQVDPKTAGASIGKVRTVLTKATYSAEDVDRFGELWWADEWRKKQGKPPSLWALQEKIGIVRNGNGRNGHASPTDIQAQCDAFFKDNPRMLKNADEIRMWQQQGATVKGVG